MRAARPARAGQNEKFTAARIGADPATTGGALSAEAVQSVTRARTIYLIKRLQALTYERLDEALRPFGLTPSQYSVLSVLGHRERLSSAQLSRRFSVKPQSMFKLITALERNGLVSRVVDHADRRALTVSLTAAGRQLLKDCEVAVDRTEQETLACLPEHDLEDMRRSMIAVLNHNIRK